MFQRKALICSQVFFLAKKPVVGTCPRPLIRVGGVERQGKGEPGGGLFSLPPLPPARVPREQCLLSPAPRTAPGIDWPLGTDVGSPPAPAPGSSPEARAAGGSVSRNRSGSEAPPAGPADCKVKAARAASPPRVGFLLIHQK